MSQPPPVSTTRTLRRAIAAAAVGNATEWFDIGLYAYAVTYVAAAIFPGSTADAVFFALGALAISYAVRPLGGLVWGPQGDRVGRRTVLTLTILLMAAATFCIGLLPTYDRAGFWAPLLLVVLRLVQGFSTGGEYSGAATFMAEYSPDRKRGFYGSFLEVGTLAGLCCGASLMLGMSLLLDDAAMQAWGWRVPFFLALPLGGVGLYLRSRMEDTPVFRELADAGQQETSARSQFSDLLRRYWKSLLLLAGLVLPLNVVNYILLGYAPTYLTKEIGLSADAALFAPLVAMLAMTFVVPVAGSLSDRFGRKPLWWVSLVGLFVLVTPMYVVMGTGIVGAVVGTVVLGLLYIPQLATISGTFPAMFPTHVRVAGLGIAYNVSTSLFGGTSAAVSDRLIRLTGNDLMPAFYMMLACAVGAVALYFVTETAGRSIRGRELPGTVSADPVSPPRRTSAR